MNDEDLTAVLRRLAEVRDDQAAWRKLYKANWPLVVAVAGRRLGGMLSMADDVAQDVFLRLLKYARFSQFQDAQHFKRYLITITNRVCDDELRRLSVRRKHERDGENPGELPGLGASPDQMAEAREMAVKIANCLSDGERTLLRLVMEGHDLGEIAAISNLSYGATATRISRAREKLRNLLDENDL